MHTQPVWFAKRVMIEYNCCLHTRQHHSEAARGVPPRGSGEKVRGATRHLTPAWAGFAAIEVTDMELDLHA